MNRTVFALRNYCDKAVKIIKNPQRLGFYTETYLLSRLKKTDPDGYIVSYPKSGRTWVRAALQDMAHGQGVNPKDFPTGHYVRLDQKLIKFDHDVGDWVPAPRPIHQLNFNQHKYQGKRVCFLTRDPRDILVSSWYHLTYRERIYRGSLSDFIRDDHLGIAKIVAFMNVWIRHRTVPKAFMILSYEELHQDPRSSFQRLFQFMGLPLNGAQLDQMIKRTSFQAMQAKEKSQQANSPWMDRGADGSGKGLKMRSGKIGEYRQEMQEDDIQYCNEILHTRLEKGFSYAGPP